MSYSYFEKFYFVRSLLWHIWQYYKKKTHLENLEMQYSNFKNSSKESVLWTFLKIPIPSM